jgi:hypothetical protein
MSTLKDLIREQVRETIREQLGDLGGLIQKVIGEELGVSTPTQPADRPQPRSVRGYKQEWPKGTTVRINGAYRGNPAAPSTTIYKVWATIKQFLKPAEEMERWALAQQISTLTDIEPHAVSTILTRLLRSHALIATNDLSHSKDDSPKSSGI